MDRSIFLLAALSIVVGPMAAEAQTPEEVRALQLENELLKLKVEKLQRENAELRARLTPDLFAKGAKFTGTFRFGGSTKSGNWSMAITERQGERFEGVYSFDGGAGAIANISVTGKAPRGVNGAVTFTSERFPNGGFFSFRGKMTNAKIALQFTNSATGGGGVATFSPAR